MSDQNFSLAEMTLNMGGLDIRGGYGADGAFKVSKPKPEFSYKEGLAGGGVWWSTSSVYIEVEISYTYGDGGAAILMAIALADKLIPGSGIVPFLWHDNNGTLTIASTGARVIEYPQPELGAEPKDSTFKIGVPCDIAYIPI